MPKARMRKAPEMRVISETFVTVERDFLPTPSGNAVRFVHVPTADVLKLESDDGRELKGAFVRYSPKLRRSERGSFDAAEIRRAFKARGATVVITSPVLLPDLISPTDVDSGTHVDPREELRAWFGADSSDEGVEALEGCLRILDELRF